MLSNIMKKIFRKTGPGVITHTRGLTSRPNEAWKRNTFAVVAGLLVGLYAGQYFPDNFYPDFEPYLPDI
jgi:hypothetical protein